MTSDAPGGGTDPGRTWQDRARAESFGPAAELYDAVRPRYPDGLLRALLEGRPPSPPASGPAPRVLDVGTGTGILARALAAHGATVVGSDVDPAMAAVARRHGVPVHVGPFEDLELPDRYDRVTAGQAWHWIDPVRGLAAVRRLLAAGGQLWLVWNLGTVAPDVEAALDAAYSRHPGLVHDASVVRGGGRASARATAEQLAAEPEASVTVLDIGWEQAYGTAEYVRLLRTHSDHATLPPDRLEAVLADVAAAADDAGGVVPVRYTTHAVVASGLSR